MARTKNKSRRGTIKPKRETRGRKPIPDPVRVKSIGLPNSLWEAISNQFNRSEYIKLLVTRDLENKALKRNQTQPDTVFIAESTEVASAEVRNLVPADLGE